MIDAVADMTYWVGKASSMLNAGDLTGDILDEWFHACKKVDAAVSVLDEAIREGRKSSTGSARSGPRYNLG